MKVVFDKKKIAEMKKLYLKFRSPKKLAEKYSCNVSTVQYHLNGKRKLDGAKYRSKKRRLSGLYPRTPDGKFALKLRDKWVNDEIREHKCYADYLKEL